MAIRLTSAKVEVGVEVEAELGNIMKCDGEVAIYLLCETGGHLADLWTTHCIHRSHSAHIEGILQ